jgi:hypothetical protein
MDLLNIAAACYSAQASKLKKCHAYFFQTPALINKPTFTFSKYFLMPACSTAGQILRYAQHDSRSFTLVKSQSFINVHLYSTAQNKAVMPTKEAPARPVATQHPLAN